jgi:hypothetical protein
VLQLRDRGAYFQASGTSLAANSASGAQLGSDQGLTPSTLIDPDTGSIDYSTASWSTLGWTTMWG